jgi:hypothetical protein
VKVRYDEGPTSHIGPKPCVNVREGIGEASVGESIGQPSSRERVVRDADTVVNVEGNTSRRVSVSAAMVSRGLQTLACAEVPCSGTGRSRS